jgi:hypothetical protein
MTGDIGEADLFARNVRRCERSFGDELEHETVRVVRLESEGENRQKVQPRTFRSGNNKSGQNDQMEQWMVVENQAHY